MSSRISLSTYDADGECLENSISKIGEYFNINLNNEQITQVLDKKNIYIVDLFSQLGLRAFAFLHPISIINMFNWKHFFRFRKYIYFGNRKCCFNYLKNDKICVLMHFSFFNLYGVSGPWHHYIVYYRDNGKFVAHDELRRKLSLEFPNLKAQMPFREAWLAASTKIVIWK
jgi:hypothetical protein